MNKNRGAKSARIAYVTATVLLVVMAVSAFIYIYSEYSKYEEDTKASADVASKVVQNPKAPDNVEAFDKNLLRRINFSKLWQINDAAKRWMFVPGTKINAPVLNEPNVGSYFYDLRGLNKRRNRCGSFLVPKAPTDSDGNEVDDGHLFILGHRMNNYNGEWQFSNLPTRWGTKDGANEYPYVYIYYPDHAERWKVWMALDARGSDMIYDIPTKIGSDDYEAMLKHAQSISRYQTDVVVDKDTHTLFMSTCNRPRGRAWIRFVLVSVPDANYYYDSQTYIDMRDKHKENIWKKGLKESRLGTRGDVMPNADFNKPLVTNASNKVITTEFGVNRFESH